MKNPALDQPKVGDLAGILVDKKNDRPTDVASLYLPNPNYHADLARAWDL